MIVSVTAAGHGLEHDREATGVLEGERVVGDLHGLLRRAALRAVAAERRVRSAASGRRGPSPGCRPRRSRGRARRSRACRPAPPETPGHLDLDRVAAGLLHVADGRLDRLLVRAPGSCRTGGRRPSAASRAPRRTARASISISSIETGTVES